MAQIVVTGATTMCTFGTVPGNLTVTSQAVCLVDGKPAATIQDAQTANITPFGMCTSLANPQVAAATAAALGVLTPQPCMPVAAGTWIPTKPGVLIGGKPCLTSDCKLICGNGGGSISITFPGQVKAVIS
uniref:DUF4280 domain-containing protein n=1 Tax=Agathobacter sp. TaxID=2021311 RepID=UPI0040578BBB